MTRRARRPACSARRLPAVLLVLALSAGPAALADESSDLAAIEALLAADRLDEAREAVTRFAVAYPKSEQVPVLLLRLAHLEPQVFGRLARLRRVAQDFPTAPAAADALVELVQLAHLSADPRETIRRCEEFRRRFPTEARIPEILRIEALALLDQGRHAAARDLLATLRTLAPGPENEALALRADAEAFLAEEKPDRARNYLEKALAAGVGDLAGALYRLGEIAYAQGQEDRARRAFEMLLERFPESLYARGAEERLGRMRQDARPGR